MREGVLRAAEYAMGRYWDVHCFSMLKGSMTRCMALEKGFVYRTRPCRALLWDAKIFTGDTLTGAPLDGYRADRVVGTREMGERSGRRRNTSPAWATAFSFTSLPPARAVRSFVRWAARPEDFRTKARHYPNIDKKGPVPSGLHRGKVRTQP